MADSVWNRVLTEYPEYAELNSLLALAAKTWPAYGISAAELARLGEGELEMLRTILEGA